MAKKKAAKKSIKKAAKKPAKKLASKKAMAKKSAATTKKAVVKKTAKKIAKMTVAKVAVKTVVAPAPMVAPTPMLVGQPVPAITAPATGGQQINLRALAGKKVVLYFYPKDMTPGCTIEGHEFTKLKPEFEKRGTVVFGVSRDSIELHEKFKAKECYSIDLLSDADEKLCNAFGVIKDKNMYGKKVRGIERSTFVIDEGGRVIQEWRGVKAEGHAQAVLDFLQKI